VLEGPIRSGKTTRLIGWAAAVGAGGVASPDGPGGRRFVDLASGEGVALEAAAEVTDVELVGRFRFARAAFGWAAARVAAALAEPSRRWVALDEIGPLELAGGGFAGALPGLLAAGDGRLVVVIRAGLVPALAARFGFTPAPSPL
jgi:nucleoside-triphosphatase THEP1